MSSAQMAFEKRKARLAAKKTEECWTCGKKGRLHSTYRDALGEYELTCDDCHRNEYPEEYGEDEGEYDCGCYYKHIPDAPFMCDKNGADYQYHDKNGCRTGSRILYKKDEDGDWCENYVCLSCVDDWKEQGAREEDEMSDDAVWREG